uniref:UPF3A regulator of nonsense mediated mRNA decay n=1 Tax=Athene cunicularia TaxID=194338 RepID=A0A663LQK0_ATHCN
MCSPRAAAPFRTSQPAAAWGPPLAVLWISAPPWSCMGCRRTTCFTTDSSMGISDPTPGAPSLTLSLSTVYRSKINLHFLSYIQVVIRRLPPCLTKEQLEEQLHPLPAHDYFEFCTADPSLYPHLYSRAYINFRNPEDILLFRDRFDGYVFIDNKGLEYPAVVEFAPFQKISKKKLKKKDAKAGSIEDDPEYRKFLESYCADEEKICANPEILLGEIEAKTRELIARRTTPLLEYIKNRKLEKQVRSDFCLKFNIYVSHGFLVDNLRLIILTSSENTRREKRRTKLLKKPEKGDELSSEKHKEKAAFFSLLISWIFCLFIPTHRSQNDSDKEQRDLERRFREKEPERQRYRLDDGRKHRAHYEFDKFVRRNEEELKWGKGYNQDRGKKGNYSYSFTVEAVDKLGKEDKCDDMASKKERIRNKVLLFI